MVLAFVGCNKPSNMSLLPFIVDDDDGDDDDGDDDDNDNDMDAR